jgi:hypothetical protein
LVKVIVQLGKVRQQNSGLLVWRQGFVGAQQHERWRDRALPSQQFAKVSVLGNEDEHVL